MKRRRKRREVKVGGVLMELPLELVVPPEAPIRSGMDETALDELVGSMKMVGLIEPLVVVKAGKRYEVVAGHRRLCAAQRLKWKQIACIVLEDQRGGEDVLKIHENLYREDVNVIDEAKFLSRLMKSKKLRHGDLANLIGRSMGYVSERLAVLKYPQDILEKLATGEMVYSVAREFARIDDEQVRREWTRIALEGGINPATAKRWREQWEKSVVEGTAAPSPGEMGTVKRVEEVYYFPCSVCEGKLRIEDTTVIRVCAACYDVIRKGGT